MLTRPLSVIEPAEGAEPTSPLPLQDRLRELVAPILIDDHRVLSSGCTSSPTSPFKSGMLMDRMR